MQTASFLKKESKKLYKRAAEYENLEAHYLLTYLFIPESRESEIEHLQFAASRGHLEALESLSESLVFRCDSLDYFDPQLLLDTFDDALQYHPVLNEEIAILIPNLVNSIINYLVAINGLKCVANCSMA